MVFYFTATGNSLYVAKQLEKIPISIAQAIHDKKTTYEADRIGIVCPVYGHEVPKPVRDFLKRAVFRTSYFYMIMTYGNRHGGAPELAEKMLREMGIKASYINVILMADNFLPGFDMNEQKAIDKKIDEHIKMIQKDIQDKRLYILPVTEKDREVHRDYLRRMKNIPEDMCSHIYHITDDCIGCGICAKVCPEKCFTLAGQKSIWNGERCITCMACIHACPMTAIQMNIPEKNPKARYRNKNISICEIIEANNQFKTQK